MLRLWLNVVVDIDGIIFTNVAVTDVDVLLFGDDGGSLGECPKHVNDPVTLILGLLEFCLVCFQFRRQ